MEMFSMTAAGGASFLSEERNSERFSGIPVTSIFTFSFVFCTHPVSSEANAILYTKGLKPTPCIRPVTVMLSDLVPTSSSSHVLYSGI